METIEKVLEEVEIFHTSEGLQPRYWVAAGDYVMSLQGYDVRKEDKHNTIDTIIQKEKSPWPIPDKYVPFMPIENPKKLDKYFRFIQKTGFEIDFHLSNEEIIKRGIEYALPNNRKIRILAPFDEVEMHGWLLKDVVNYVKKEKIQSWIKYIQEINKKAIEKEDIKVINACEKVLSKSGVLDI